MTVANDWISRMIEVWKNKKTGKTVRVTPWWEPIGDPIIDDKYFKQLDPIVQKALGKRKVALGTVAQAGWLIENENGIWIGVTITAEKQFKKVKSAYENKR